MVLLYENPVKCMNFKNIKPHNPKLTAQWAKVIQLGSHMVPKWGLKESCQVYKTPEIA